MQFDMVFVMSLTGQEIQDKVSSSQSEKLIV